MLHVIDEESESVEYDSLERSINDLEHEEETSLCVQEKNEVADLIFDRSKSSIESHALECTMEVSEEITENMRNLTENNSSSFSNCLYVAFHHGQRSETNWYRFCFW